MSDRKHTTELPRCAKCSELDTLTLALDDDELLDALEVVSGDLSEVGAEICLCCIADGVPPLGSQRAKEEGEHPLSQALHDAYQELHERGENSDGRPTRPAPATAQESILAELMEARRWRIVSEEPPPYRQRVEFYDVESFTGMRDDDWIRDDAGMPRNVLTDEVLYWRPLGPSPLGGVR